MKKILLLLAVLFGVISCLRKDMEFNITIEETFQAEISEKPLEYAPERNIFLQCTGNKCSVYTGTKYFKENLILEKNITKKDEKEIKRLLKEMENKMGSRPFIASGVHVEAWQKGKNEKRILLNSHISDEIEKTFNILGYKNPMIESDEKYIDSLTGEKFTYENIPRMSSNVWKLYCEKEMCKVFYYKMNKEKNSSTLIRKWDINLKEEKIAKLKKALMESIKNDKGLNNRGNPYVMVFDNGKYYWKFDENLSESIGEFGKIINELIKDDYKKIQDKQDTVNIK